MLDRLNKSNLNIKKTILIGCGFMAIGLTWSMYNAYVPLLLDNFVNKTMLIGIIMSIDNIFAVILQPVFGELSDHTRSRFGKRMPYILICMPICAILFALIPFMLDLMPLMLVIIFFNLLMSAWRTPVIALMPDMTPRELRSQANGLINLMGGVGGILALLIGGALLLGNNMNIPFLFGGLTIALIWVVFLLALREPPLPPDGQTFWQRFSAARKQELAKRRTDLSAQRIHNKNLLYLLIAVFFVFAGINSMETFFTLYATKSLAVEASKASFMLAYFAFAFLASAIPAGLIGAKLGRKRVIVVGVALTAILFIIAFFIRNLIALRILLLTAGFSWALVNTNLLPLVLDLASEEHLGRYTGYYYFFSSAASIASPALFGLINDLFQNYSLLFVYAAVTFALAIMFLFFTVGKNKSTSRLTVDRI